ALRAKSDVRRISVEALRLLRDHSWPGNVRELENAIEHAVVLARGEAIMPADLPLTRQPQSGDAEEATRSIDAAGEVLDRPYAEAKDKAMLSFDRLYIEGLMKRTGGNISEAARQAGMDRSNFRRLLKKVRSKQKDGAEEAP